MPEHKPRTKVSAREKQNVLAMLDRGKGVHTIVRETGISRSKVYAIKKEYTAVSKYPRTPLQEEAWGRCQQGDHTWMTGPDQDRFADHAFEIKVIWGKVLIRNNQEGIDYIKRQPEVVDFGYKENPFLLSYEVVPPGIVKHHPSYPKETPEGDIWPMRCTVRTCYFCGHRQELECQWCWGSLSTAFTPREADLKVWFKF
jgi:hypothetical protein